MHNNRFWSRGLCSKDSVSVQSLRFLIMRHFTWRQGGGDSRTLGKPCPLCTLKLLCLKLAFLGWGIKELFQKFTAKLFSKKACSKRRPMWCGKASRLTQALPPVRCVGLGIAHTELRPFRLRSSAWEDLSSNNTLKAPGFMSLPDGPYFLLSRLCQGPLCLKTSSQAERYLI